MAGTGVVTLELACRYRDPGEELLQAHSGLKKAGILHKVPLESHAPDCSEDDARVLF